MKYKIIRTIVISFIITGFVSCHSAKVKDVDGNSYNTITIGNQIWLKENLKVTRFNDGTPIPLVRDNDSWITQTGPAYCWYANDSANKDIYGALYNFHTVDSKKLCPTGWHVPDQADWYELVNIIGDVTVTGDKLKEAGTSHWKSPNNGADNKFGFTALPAGYRSFNGSFNYMWIAAYWWSSSISIQSTAYFWYMRYNLSFIDKLIAEKNNGFSVRCIKDKPVVRENKRCEAFSVLTPLSLLVTRQSR